MTPVQDSACYQRRQAAQLVFGRRRMISDSTRDEVVVSLVVWDDGWR